MKYLKNKELIILLSIYLCITIYLSVKDAVYYVNIVNPLFWAGILVYLIWTMKKGYIRFYINRKNYICMFVILCINLLVYICTGFVCGLAKSPYNHSLVNILKNIIIQIIPIIGIELTRGFIISKNKKNKFIIFLVTVLLTFVQIKYNVFVNSLSNREMLFQYICGTILPLIFSNVLYTYLSLKVSFSISPFIRSFNRLLTILLPVIPNADWFTRGSIGAVLPLGIYVWLKYNAVKDNNNIRKRENSLVTKISYIITIAISVTIICFMLGVFKYEPITILSNSMVPEFSRGDVVIYKKLNENELNKIKKNSVIIYEIGEQSIAHRVVNIVENNGIILYQTKGDSNNAPDLNLVETKQIKGLYVFHIKYVGFPSVWLYEYFNSENAEAKIK